MRNTMRTINHRGLKWARLFLPLIMFASLARVTVNYYSIVTDTTRERAILSERRTLGNGKKFTYYVPLAYHISHWTHMGTQFYHTYQCLWAGIEAAKVDPEVAGKHPDRVAFVTARDGPFPDHSFLRLASLKRHLSKFKDPSSLIRKMEHAFWETTDSVSFQDLIATDNPKPLTAKYLENIHDRNRACVSYRMFPTQMEWFSKFLAARFGSTAHVPFGDEGHPNNEIKNNDKIPSENSRSQRDCSVEQMRSKLKALLVNRPSSRHISEDTVHALLSSSSVASWNYTSNLGSYGILEQLRMFESHSLVVLPHGAAESNVVATAPWKATAEPGGSNNNPAYVPASVIELCPMYAHCSCMGVCPNFYKERMNGTAYFGIAFEQKGRDCEQFCSAVNRAPYMSAIVRKIFKRMPIPQVETYRIVSALESIIDTQLLPMLSSYCQGNQVILTNTNAAVIEI